jgi:hypothetical protein
MAPVEHDRGGGGEDGLLDTQLDAGLHHVLGALDVNCTKVGTHW